MDPTQPHCPVENATASSAPSAGGPLDGDGSDDLLQEVIRKGELPQAMVADPSDLTSPWTFSDGL
ncbi:MAG: hypothetical protein QM518_16505 [Verrucomicrobiota bacterium]|jgi:hypothetical protein|nr:hypothetical protein [Verrucomicrobiota bacterium]